METKEKFTFSTRRQNKIQIEKCDSHTHTLWYSTIFFHFVMFEFQICVSVTVLPCIFFRVQVFQNRKNLRKDFAFIGTSNSLRLKTKREKYTNMPLIKIRITNRIFSKNIQIRLNLFEKDHLLLEFSTFGHQPQLILSQK